MNLKEKWNKFKNAKYMWDMARVSVMVESNGKSWVSTKDYEYLAKRYKSMYFGTSLLMLGILILVVFML